MNTSSPSRKLTTAALLLSVMALGAIALGCAAEEPADDETEGVTEDPLKTKDHSAISLEVCRENGFPDKFCARVAAETFNTDINEWETLAAHGQPEKGQSKCDAAAAVQSRLKGLGGEIRGVLASKSVSADAANKLATALGRSLHTIQDNCAHSGMTNPQHAWYTIRDWCISSGESPDDQPGALECARAETSTVIRGFRAALTAAGISSEGLATATKVSTSNPGRRQACEFMREWQNFDGRDSRWNNNVTRAGFRTELVQAFTADKKSVDLCTKSDALDVSQPRASVSVSDPFCITLSAFCIGH